MIASAIPVDINVWDIDKVHKFVVIGTSMLHLCRQNRWNFRVISSEVDWRISCSYRVPLRHMDPKWLVLAAFLVLFMQLGFALVTSGFTRAQNVAHTVSTVLLLYGVGILGYWIAGFAFEAGSGHEFHLSVFGHRAGVIGLTGFAPGSSIDVRTLAVFALDAALMLVALAIPIGALAERWRLASVAIFGAVMSLVVYPVFANWIGAGGWLSRLGQVGMGHGVVDFGGSLGIHALGGLAGLAGAHALGPRLRKFTKDGRPLAIPGHNIPMAMAGTFVLVFGWVGIVIGFGEVTGIGQFVVVAANLALASAAALVASTAFVWWRFGTPDPTMMSNGMLAGLVGVSAASPFVGTGAAVTIGAVAGLLVVMSVFFVERRLRIDDPVGAISIHGACGMWGALALGLFANGTAGTGLNGVAGPVRGLFYGDASQMLAQTIGVLIAAAYTLFTVGIVFRLLDAMIGNRVAPEAELEGLDVSQLGTVSYPDFSLASTRHDPTAFFVERHHN